MVFHSSVLKCSLSRMLQQQQLLLAIISTFFFINESWAQFLPLSFHSSPGIRVNNLPDFVGFSYSRAVLPSVSRRFIHFSNEILNINSNFHAMYGSFQASRPGIYGFHYSFISPRGAVAVVSLRKNGSTIISAMSEENGNSPASQSVLLSLKTGDVIQLEIMKGSIYEGGHPDFSYTSFSGWLITGHNNDDTNSRRNDDCCRCPPPRICPSIPPYRPTLPPFKPSPPRTTSKPTTMYPIYTTTTSTLKPNYISTSTRRTPRHECCQEILVSDISESVQKFQSMKLGIYKLHGESEINGRNIYKHCDNQVYLYYDQDRKWEGWMFGPEIHGIAGGILSESYTSCPEDVVSGSWIYYGKGNFINSVSLKVECFINRSKGRSIDSTIRHYHKHDHFYHDDDAIIINNHRRSFNGPEYEVKATDDYVKATFIYPSSGKSNDTIYHSKPTSKNNISLDHSQN